MNFRKNMLSQQDYILHVDVNNNKLQAKENPATWTSWLETRCSSSCTTCSPQNLGAEAPESLEILLWDSTL